MNDGGVFLFNPGHPDPTVLMYVTLIDLLSISKRTKKNVSKDSSEGFLLALESLTLQWILLRSSVQNVPELYAEVIQITLKQQKGFTHQDQLDSGLDSPKMRVYYQQSLIVRRCPYICLTENLTESL